MTNDLRTLSEQMTVEDKYRELRAAIAELQQYAQGLTDGNQADAMAVWLMNEHAALIASAFKAYAYGQQMREMYTNANDELQALLVALAEGDTTHEDVADALDTARNDGEKYALSGLIVRIAAAQGIANSDVSQLLNALEHPDRVSPFFADRLADRLERMARDLRERTTADQAS